MGKLTVPVAPMFETTLPSGKSISYRPFLSKEESFLLQAKEVGNDQEIISIIHQIIESCCPGTKPKSLDILDLEWLFLKIRMKSVGEEVEQNYRCLNVVDGKKCGCRIQTHIDLNDVSVVGEKKPQIKMNFASGQYTITFKQPTLQTTNITELDRFYSLVETINDPVNGLITKEDFSLSDFSDFVGSFTTTQYEEFRAATNSLASLYYKEDIVCPKCGSATSKEYRTLLDFFI